MAGTAMVHAHKKSAVMSGGIFLILELLNREIKHSCDVRGLLTIPEQEQPFRSK